MPHWELRLSFSPPGTPPSTHSCFPPPEPPAAEGGLQDTPLPLRATRQGCDPRGRLEALSTQARQPPAGRRGLVPVKQQSVTTRPPHPSSTAPAALSSVHAATASGCFGLRPHMESREWGRIPSQRCWGQTETGRVHPHPPRQMSTRLVPAHPADPPPACRAP